MFEGIKRKIEEIRYGKRLYNLIIKPIYDANIELDSKTKRYFDDALAIGLKRGYIGNFIVTEKDYFINGYDKNLETEITAVNLSEKDFPERIFNLRRAEQVIKMDGRGILLTSKLSTLGRMRPYVIVRSEIRWIEKTKKGNKLV